MSQTFLFRWWFWLLAALLLGMIMLLRASGLFDPAQPPVPFTRLAIEVTGHDYQMHYRYPGDDRVLYSRDDRYTTQNLVVPEEATVQLRLTSTDFAYTLEIPVVDVYEIAAPDLFFEVQFRSPSVGEYELLGSQMCGYDHPGLLGKLIVQTDDDFRRTMSRFSTTSLSK